MEYLPIFEIICALGLLFVMYWWGTKRPNGELVVWHRHPRIIEGHKYHVRALVDECLKPGLTKWRCALLQDEHGRYKPFAVFFPPKEECDVIGGQMVQPIWRGNREYILVVVSQQVFAC